MYGEYARGDRAGFQYDFRESQEYKNAVEQLTAANSPYLSELQNLSGMYGSYSPNAGEWINSLFTKNENMYASQYTDLQNAAFAAINAVLQKENARVYNLPVNQSQLERNAGLNTDLTGISGSGAVTDADNPVELPSLANMAENYGNSGLAFAEGAFTVSSAALNMLTGAAGSVLNFIEKGYQIKDAAASVAQKEIGTYDVAQDFIIKEILNTASTRDFEDPLKIDPATLLNFAKSADVSGFSRSTQKFLKRYQDSLNVGDFGVDSALYKRLRDMVENKRSAALTIGMPDYSDNFAEMLDIMRSTSSSYIFTMQQNEAKLSDLSVTIKQYEEQVAGATVDASIREAEGHANVADADGYVAQQSKVSKSEYLNAKYEYEKTVAELGKSSRELISALNKSIDSSNLPDYMKASLKYALFQGENVLTSLLQMLGSGGFKGAASRGLSSALSGDKPVSYGQSGSAPVTFHGQDVDFGDPFSTF